MAEAGAESHEAGARAAIGAALARYCRAWDRGDIALALSVWHEDGTAQYLTEPTAPVRLMIPERLESRRLSGLRTSHQITNFTLEVAAERAVSEAYGTAWSWERRPGGKILERHYVSRYLDRWSHRDGRWAIDHRRVLLDGYRSSLVTAEPELDSVTAASRMDPKDPSYAHFASLRRDRSA